MSGKKIKRNEKCPCGSEKKHKHCCLNIDNEYVVFCDESGNSGSNFLDKDQPFFIIAGWIVPKTIINNTEAIHDFANSMNIVGEIHGTNIIRGRKGQQAIIELFKKLGKIGCVPSFIFAEKKYCIAGKIVETLLDPEHNDTVDNGFSWDNEKKKQLAEVFYNLPEDLLRIFAQAYRTHDISLMISCTTDISAYLSTVNNQELSQKIMSSLTHIETNMELERICSIKYPNKAMASLNLPTITSYINILEQFGRAINAKISIVHDKIIQYEDAYKEVYHIYANSTPSEFTLTNGAKIIFGFDHLSEIAFVPSNDNHWVMAADLLASTLNRCLKSNYQDEDVSKEFSELSSLIFPTLLLEDLKISDCICSVKTLKNIFDNLVKESI